MSANNKFISEFEKVLSKYLSNAEVLAFLRAEEINVNNLPNDFSNRIAIRFISESIVSFSELKLEPDDHKNLLLDIVNIIIEKGEYQIAEEMILHLISICGSDEKDKYVKGKAILKLAVIYANIANWNNCFRYVKQSAKIFTDIKSNHDLIRCENLLGCAYCENGDFQTALNHFDQARKIENPINDEETSKMIDVNIGLVTLLTGKFDLSYSFLKRALLYYEKTKDHEKTARVRHNLGMLHIEKKEYDKALKEFEESITISEKNGLFPILTISLLSKAFIYSEISDLRLSNYFAGKAFDLANSINDILTIADVYKVNGMNYRRKSEYELSKIQFLNALRLNKNFNNQLNFAETNHQFALLYIELNKKVDAQNCLNQTLKFYLKSGMKFRVTVIQELLDKF